MGKRIKSWSVAGGKVGKECTFDMPSGDTQRFINLEMMELANDLKLPLLLTTDSHMVSPDLKFVQDILLQNGNPDGWRFTEAYYQMTTEQAWDLWSGSLGLADFSSEFKEAVENNELLVSMVDKIHVETRIRMPSVNVPQKVKDKFPEDLDAQYLRMIADLIKEHGRMPRDEPEYITRLEEEIEVIANNGVVNFLPYFLFVEEVCRKARAAGENSGPGRGSAAGCLLAYLLNITHLDPIKWGLSFYRFLSNARIGRRKFPDIDLDFANPSVVAEIMKAELGDRFIRICTLGTIRGRSAIREVSRVVLSTQTDPEKALEVDEVAKALPFAPQGVADSKGWIFGYTDEMEVFHPGIIDEIPIVANFFEKYPQVRRGVEDVLNIPKSIGRHASAYAAADSSIPDIIPICRVNGEECTQYPMGPVEAMGLIKMDILGLNTLKDVSGAVSWVGRIRGKNIDIYDIPLDDEKTWLAFHEGRNETVFQFNKPIGIDLSRRYKPVSILDLAQMTAAGRPGTLFALMPDGETTLVDQWVGVRDMSKNPSFVHPSVKGILEPTGGVCLFQEQITEMFQIACGYSEEEADEIREIVGKKKKDKMDALIPEIRLRLSANGWTESQTESFISLCIAASNYSFNKCIGLDVKLQTPNGDRPIGCIEKGEFVKAYEVATGSEHFVRVTDVMDSEAELWEVELENEMKLQTSINHKYLCEDGTQRPLWEILQNGWRVFTQWPHSDCEITQLSKIVSVRSLGMAPTRDLEVDSKDHNFIANGVVVSNSHSLAYSYLGYVCQYLKKNYPVEWWASALQNSSKDDLRANARFCSRYISTPDVISSDVDVFVADKVGRSDKGRIVFPLRMVHGVKTAAEAVIEARPFCSMEELYQKIDRKKANKRVFSALIWSGAMDNLFGVGPRDSILGRNAIYRRYLELRGEKQSSFTDLNEIQVMKAQGDAFPMIEPDYAGYLSRITERSVQCASVVAARADGARTSIGGVVREIKKINTKKGDAMCFISVANQDSTASVTVFSDLYSEVADFLKVRDLVVVNGRINDFGGKRSLVADTIIFPETENQ